MGRLKKETNKLNPIQNKLDIKKVLNIYAETVKTTSEMQDLLKKDTARINKNLQPYLQLVDSLSENITSIYKQVKNKKCTDISKNIIEFRQNNYSKTENIDKRYKQNFILIRELNIKNNELKESVLSLKENFGLNKQYVLEFITKQLQNIKQITSIELFNKALEDNYGKINNFFLLLKDSSEKFNDLTNTLLKELYDVTTVNLADFSRLLQKLILINYEILCISDEKTSVLPLLKEKSAKMKNSIDLMKGILKNEEVIQQQIIHLNSIHHMLISELNTLSNSENNYIDLTNNKITLQLPAVTETQLIQLLYIGIEYKNILDVCRNKLIEISDLADEFKTDNDLYSDYFRRLEKNIRKELQDIINEFDGIYESLNNFIKKYASDIKALEKISDEMYYYITLLISNNANFEQLLFNIIQKHFKTKKRDNTINNQIERLISDNNKLLQQILILYSVIQKNSKLLSISIDSSRNEVFQLKTKNEFYQKVDSDLKEILSAAVSIDKLLHQNNSICKTLSEKITIETGNTDNYISFSKLMNEHIKNFNIIYQLLLNENLNINQYKRDLLLKQTIKRQLFQFEKPYQNKTLNKIKGKNYLNKGLFDLYNI